MDVFKLFGLHNKKIIITGASSGIGRQCAVLCSRMGAKVIAIGRSHVCLKDTIDQLEGTGHCFYVFDLMHLDDISLLMNNILNEIGKVDGFVHAAGIEKTLPMKILKPVDYENLYRLNVLSGIEISRFFHCKKNANEGSRIVFISSILSVVGRPGVAAYAASKGAIVSLVKTMAIEFSKKKINVNCISPGTVLTPMMMNYLSSLSEEDKRERLKGFLLGVGRPEDVASVCVFLLSDAAAWMTGQNLIVDGGYTIQ